MRSVVSRHKYFLFLILIFIISELIVNPIGDFPLNDDWSYGKSVYYLSLYDEYTIGSFSAMTLFTHLVWGTMFVKIFGFSFTVLRLSTMASAVIGLFFLDKLVTGITGNKLLGFLSCLVLLFNPLYFNLANTFMTDVNFTTLLILCCYLAFEFFRTRKMIFFFLFFLAAALLVLLRQFGIIMPACFIVACLMLKEKRWLFLICSLAGTALVYLVFKKYENYLAGILPEWASYKFSGKVGVADTEFWKLVKWNFSQRYGVLLAHLLVYTAPVALLFMGSLIRDFKISYAIVIALLSFVLVYWLFSGVQFPHHNIFTNMSLGPETFYESLQAKANHTYSRSFDHVIQVIKLCFGGITVTVSALFLARTIQRREYRFWRPDLVFLFAGLLTYSFMIFITESYFDRYHIPLILLGMLLFAFISRQYKADHRLIIVPLLCFFYVSVFGTKDYLSWNRVRWEAYEYLRDTEKVTAKNVNGGFEVNCLNDMAENWWYDYTTLNTFDYLIQFRKEEGFRLLKEYGFRRYFPYRNDKINIFVKEDKDKKDIPDK